MPYKGRKAPAARHRGARWCHVSDPAQCVIWAMDLQVDQTADGRMLKFFDVVDELMREALATDVSAPSTPMGVVRCLERLAAQRGAPVYVRFDHGREFIAYAVAGCCRFNARRASSLTPQPVKLLRE